MNSFSSAFVIIFDLILASHVYNPSSQNMKNMHFTFTFLESVLTLTTQVQLQNVENMLKQNCSFLYRSGHLPPLFAVHLLAVVSMDVEWCPNPLKVHVGTVCISFSHLGERPQPSLFTGIPSPHSVQPQPTALA